MLPLLPPVTLLLVVMCDTGETCRGLAEIGFAAVKAVGRKFEGI